MSDNQYSGVRRGNPQYQDDPRYQDYLKSDSGGSDFVFGGRFPFGNNHPRTPTIPYNLPEVFRDPFGTAMSGNQTGTLQPYVNRMNQNASDALYGGLLNYQPQSMIAGNAGGTPQNSSVPQGFNIPNELLNFKGFGNRSWMNQNGNS